MTVRGQRGGPPLRVAVLGASATVQTSWHGGPRADIAYPRVIEKELLAAGVRTTVEVAAIPADRVHHVAASARALEPWQPDVFVIHVGQADSVLLFLPRWLERHANSPRRRPGRVRDLYRSRVLRPIWIGLAKLQVRVDARVDSTKVRARQRRTAAEVAALLDAIRASSSALVLVCELVRPGPPWRNWFPGIGDRMAALNGLFAAAVEERADPAIRVVPLQAPLLAALGPDEEPTPDGGHFTPRAHQVVGAALAAEIVAWADRQGS